MRLSRPRNPGASTARERIVLLEDGFEHSRGTLESYLKANFDDVDLVDALETWSLSGMRHPLRLGGGAAPQWEFVRERDYKRAMNPSDRSELTVEHLRQMTQGYLEAAAFTDDVSVPWTHDAYVEAMRACEWFTLITLRDDRHVLPAWFAHQGAGFYGWVEFGRDLWYTRNGHGTGFWDRKRDAASALEPTLKYCATRLTSRAKKMGDVLVEKERYGAELVDGFLGLEAVGTLLTLIGLQPAILPSAEWSGGELFQLDDDMYLEVDHGNVDLLERNPSGEGEQWRFLRSFDADGSKLFATELVQAARKHRTLNPSDPASAQANAMIAVDTDSLRASVRGYLDAAGFPDEESYTHQSASYQESAAIAALAIEWFLLTDARSKKPLVEAYVAFVGGSYEQFGHDLFTARQGGAGFLARCAARKTRRSGFDTRCHRIAQPLDELARRMGPVKLHAETSYSARGLDDPFVLNTSDSGAHEGLLGVLLELSGLERLDYHKRRDDLEQGNPLFRLTPELVLEVTPLDDVIVNSWVRGELWGEESVDFSRGVVGVGQLLERYVDVLRRYPPPVA